MNIFSMTPRVTEKTTDRIECNSSTCMVPCDDNNCSFFSTQTVPINPEINQTRQFIHNIIRSNQSWVCIKPDSLSCRTKSLPNLQVLALYPQRRLIYKVLTPSPLLQPIRATLLLGLIFNMNRGPECRGYRGRVEI